VTSNPPLPTLPSLPLSISIVSCNEEENLQRCLESAADLASEIIVVDSGSQDSTKEIAQSFGAKVIEQEWLGFRDQKNFALDQCSQPWILALDCDEALSPELKQSVINFFAQNLNARYDSASCNRLVWFLGRWIKHGDWYPDTKTRLFKREQSRWGGSIEHDKIEVQSNKETLQLSGDLLHFSFKEMGCFVEKINRYADAFLERKKDARETWSLWDNITRPPWRFFRAYIMRRGFLDGFPGLWIATATAFQCFVRYSVTFQEENSNKCPSCSIAQAKDTKQLKEKPQKAPLTNGANTSTPIQSP